MRVLHQQLQARAHVRREGKHALTSLKGPRRKADPLPGAVNVPRDRALLPPTAHVPAFPPPAPEQAERALPQSQPSRGLPARTRLQAPGPALAAPVAGRLPTGLRSCPEALTPRSS